MSEGENITIFAGGTFQYAQKCFKQMLTMFLFSNRFYIRLCHFLLMNKFTQASKRVFEFRKMDGSNKLGLNLNFVAWHSRNHRIKNRKEIQEKHCKELITLSEKQSRPLFSVENTVIFSDFTGNIPNYVRHTLVLGTRHPIMS